MSATGHVQARHTSSIFWRYWSAGLVSRVGSTVTAIALPLTALTVLDATTLQVSLIATASYVGWLVLGLPAGVLIRSLPLRGTQVATDLVRALAILTIPLAWWFGALTMAHLVVSALIVSFANVLFDVGNMTFLPVLVSKEELHARNSLVSGADATTQLAGPALGGALIQLIGSVPVLVVDAVSYLVSAALMRTLPAREVVQPAERAAVVAMIREGCRFVFQHPIMRPCTYAALAVNFVCGALLALTPIYLVRELGASAALVGVLLAAEGIGSLLGSAVCTPVTHRLGSARTLFVAAGLAALSALVVPLGVGTVGMICFAVGNIGFAAGIVILSIELRTHRQSVTPPELLSRVMATVRFVSWGALPLGSLCAGLAATALGVHPALWITCALTIVPLALFGFSPIARMRNLEDE